MKKVIIVFWKVIKAIFNLMFVLATGYDEDIIEQGYLDFSGQGRDEYGR